MIEVVDGAGMTVKGWDTTVWCDAIQSVYNNCERYRTLGFQRSKQYDWATIVQSIAQTLGNT